MKRRNIFKSNNDSLPSLSSYASSPRGGGIVDGSGRGVKMDAPIVRSWKKASGYTKGSYIWSIVSLLVMIWSYRFMMYRYGKFFFECKKKETFHDFNPNINLYELMIYCTF